MFFAIPGCEKKGMCPYQKTMDYLKAISFKQDGYSQAALEKNCNDISIIHSEMNAKGIPLHHIGKDRNEIHKKKEIENKSKGKLDGAATDSH